MTVKELYHQLGNLLSQGLGSLAICVPDSTCAGMSEAMFVDVDVESDEVNITPEDR